MKDRNTIDGANIYLTCGLSQKWMVALNSYGQLLLKKDAPIAIIFTHLGIKMQNIYSTETYTQ